MQSNIFFIGMAGGTACGKTSICKVVQQKLADSVLVISIDSFYLGLPPNINPDKYNFDDPAAIDWNCLFDVLTDLKIGKSAKIPVYDFFSHSRKAEYITVEPKPCVIVEGILALFKDDLTDFYDYCVYVDTPADIRLTRRIQRDSEERGRDCVSVINQYLKTVRPAHERYVEPTKQKANRIIPWIGQNYVEVDALICYIKTKVD